MSGPLGWRQLSEDAQHWLYWLGLIVTIGVAVVTGAWLGWFAYFYEGMPLSIVILQALAAATMTSGLLMVLLAIGHRYVGWPRHHPWHQAPRIVRVETPTSRATPANQPEATSPLITASVLEQLKPPQGPISKLAMLQRLMKAPMRVSWSPLGHGLDVNVTNDDDEVVLGFTIVLTDLKRQNSKGVFVQVPEFHSGSTFKVVPLNGPTKIFNESPAQFAFLRIDGPNLRFASVVRHIETPGIWEATFLLSGNHREPQTERLCFSWVAGDAPMPWVPPPKAVYVSSAHPPIKPVR